jgi:hypothetical protein
MCHLGLLSRPLSWALGVDPDRIGGWMPRQQKRAPSGVRAAAA